jgi:hypothetical protein
MIPGNLHPSYSPTGVCEALACKWRGYAVTACKTEGCGHGWQREAAEDRARREAKDKQRMRGRKENA